MSLEVSFHWKRGHRSLLCRAISEPLERRTLLAISFAAEAYATPTNRADVQLPTSLEFPESVIRINPLNPANLAVGTARTLMVSTDAGATWSAETQFPFAFSALRGDPDLAFDSQGRLFFSMLVRLPGQTHIAVAQMNPLTGAPIGSPGLVPVPAGHSDDKPFLAIDSNPDSPFADTLYLTWARQNLTINEFEILVSHSSDQGQTWAAPIQVSDFDGPDNVFGTPDDEGFCWPSDVAVGPNGDVYVSYHAQPEMSFAVDVIAGENPDGVSGKSFVLRSTDGGLTFPQKTEAFPAGTSDITGNSQHASNGGNIAGTQFVTAGSWTPYILPDPVRPGHVYIINSDDPDNVHGSGDDADVVIARSTDNGLTWTRSTVISGPNESFQLFPVASIDRFGNIALMWLDNRRGLTNSSGRYLLDFMATYSTDGGLTWAPEFRFNDLPFDPDPNPIIFTPGPPPSTRIGEYFGIELYGGTAHMVFDGNFFSGTTPLRQQIMYSSFAIAGAMTVTGDDGSSDDVISINPLPGDSDYLEVIVNGRREYAGLFEGLAGITIDAGAGRDMISISATGADLPITILQSAGEDVVGVNVAGVGAANVMFADTQRLDTLSIGAGGLATVAWAGNRVLTVESLNITGTGTLDLADNSLIIDYSGDSPLPQVQTWLTSGYNSGGWNGSGINSAAAASTAGHALGYAEASDLSVIPPIFGPVDDTAILVTYTLYGDADLNRAVNLNDFNRLAANFGQTDRRWSLGDFDFNSIVNLNDFNRLAANFGRLAAPPAAALSFVSSRVSEELTYRLSPEGKLDVLNELI